MLSNLDLQKARLKALGGSAEERMQREKLKSLEAALKYSYQAKSYTFHYRIHTYAVQSLRHQNLPFHIAIYNNL